MAAQWGGNNTATNQTCASVRWPADTTKEGMNLGIDSNKVALNALGQQKFNGPEGGQQHPPVLSSTHQQTHEPAEAETHVPF